MTNTSRIGVRTSPVVVGQRWRENITGRVVVILETHYRRVGPAWYYEDESPEDWHFRHDRACGEWGLFTLLGPRATVSQTVRAR